MYPILLGHCGGCRVVESIERAFDEDNLAKATKEKSNAVGNVPSLSTEMPFMGKRWQR